MKKEVITNIDIINHVKRNNEKDFMFRNKIFNI